MQRIVELITSKVHTRKGAELSICTTTAIANTITANNTVAILSVGDIAKNIATRFDIDPRRTASLLDTTSCTIQGLIPYGAQLLMASGIASISALEIVPYLFYPMLLGLTVIITILFPTSTKRINKTLK
jgi:Na+/H+ antiporter NhaC